MKAVILAAGYGTRLTKDALKIERLSENNNLNNATLKKQGFLFDLDDIPLQKLIELCKIVREKPKALLPINNETVIDSTVEKLSATGAFDHIYVVSNATYYDQFESWKQQSSSKIPITILNNGVDIPVLGLVEDKDQYEHLRKGLLGDKINALEKFKIDDDVFILAGDNYMKNVDFKPIVDLFQKKKSIVITYYDVGDKQAIQRMSVLNVGSDGKVKDFVEKPTLADVERLQSTLAFPPLYMYPKRTIPMIHKAYDALGNKDGNVIQYAHDKTDVFALPLPGKRYDIGNFSSYISTIKEFEEL